jgi:iron complex transport system ATP-binding protein
VTLLSVKNLSADLGKRKVLHGVSFDVRAGEFVGLIGPNGAGKSTLLRSLLGIVPSRGDILLGGKTRLKPGEQARLVSYLPQEREIAWPVTVERLVALGRAPYLSAFGSSSAQDLDAIHAAMVRMEIDAFADRPATELSGGEQARVLIARALAQEAPLMLADEPTAGLDPAHQIALMKTFAGLAQEGSSVVACLHDLGLAARFCTRLLLIDGGEIVADGSPREVLTTERLRAIYKVEAFLAEHQGGLVVQPLDLFEG